jgi:regulator of sirC expression with transglutaminase-like and TPR domain
MQSESLTSVMPPLSESRRAALLTLLADEDPGVYRTVREAILSCGSAAGDWLRPYALSDDPVLRRHTRGILLHLGRQQADVAFLAFCLQHGEEFDLEQAVWLLAATAFPDIRIEGYRALLDHYAAELRVRIGCFRQPNPILGAINAYLFEELRFRAGVPADARLENFYFNRVLDCRMGDPIGLCLLYLLVARRLHLPVASIGLPDYVLCRYQSSSSEEVYIDVFNQGKLMSKADCIRSLAPVGRRVPADFLEVASARDILLRSCAYLHEGYLQMGLLEEATRVQRYWVALRA